MTTEYSSLKISLSEAEEIASINFGKKGVATPLPGELDFNFKICTHNENYILKVGRPGENIELLDFQQKILNHIEKQEAPFLSPKFLTDLKGKSISSFIDANGEKRNIRLLSWIDGRLWSEVNPKTGNLLVGLGEMAGKLTTSLYDFDHPCAHRAFEWDIAQSEWVNNHLDLFSSKKKFILTHFISLFKSVQLSLSHIRKSVVHNDVNDNNILITEDIESPKIRAIIDYGDAIYTQSINITCTL